MARGGVDQQDGDKTNILIQVFWICLAVLESDFKHEFLLGLRLLDRVLDRLPLDRPDVREKVEKLHVQVLMENTVERRFMRNIGRRDFYHKHISLIKLGLSAAINALNQGSCLFAQFLTYQNNSMRILRKIHYFYPKTQDY